MALELLAELALVTDAIIQVGYQPGEPADVINNLIDSEILPGALLSGAFGIFAALVGEASQRVFYAHSDTLCDPPATAIVVWSLTLGLLVIAGLINWAVWIPGTTI